MGGSWAAVHGLTGAEYQTAWNANTGAGRLTRAVTGYDDGGARFAAVWRSPARHVAHVHASAGDEPDDRLVRVHGDNPFTTLECRLDSASFAACTSPETLFGLDEGFHTFRARAVDRETVRDLSPASFTWLVDVTPPEADIIAPVENTKVVHGVPKNDPVDVTTVIGWAQVVVEATDNLSGIASVVFTVNAVPVPAGNVTHAPGSDIWSFQFVPTQNGQNPYLIAVTVTDGAGNSTIDTLPVVAVKTGKRVP